MPVLLLLLLLFPATVSAEEITNDCDEIRQILVEGVEQGYLRQRDVRPIYKRCLRRNQSILDNTKS